ncbi:serine/threonine-protein kinase BLUS1 isoform X2 [Sesamum indicum]|uniref:Serine/threonine-protein kinase BLUS1 isoform X2 n=1 Tax=Sesamum indicum TaxID=4182 RepID=A0A6I9SV08_SESIN|nr:serine/threonine-protein kinase BLUS1 isoform X2 [Sesamum indicum]
MERERKKYPIGAEHYTMYEEVGTGVSASVHRALCNPLNEIVAVKILDFERNNSDLNNISREAQTMGLVDHPNVLKSHCSFVSDHNLWVVMPYMAGGSCLHILKAAHPDGLEEVVIATILREVLKGLDYLHQHGHIHRDVKAGNILIDTRGAIKLGDFGVSAYLFDSGDRQRMRNTFVGTPCWMAPEVMEQVHGYDFKADIWSFGITALELAHGHAPFSKYPPMKVLLMTLQNAPPGLDYERDKKFSKSFKQMIASCLVKDPVKRPSARKLLKHSFFKQARSNDYIARTLLEGLPALGDRLQALKRKEEDLLAQKKMPDGQKEEISQNEYKRGISGWNFDLEDMKAQASLIQDDDSIPEKEEDMQTKQLQHQPSFSGNSKVLQHQSSFTSQWSDAADSDDNAPASVSSMDSMIHIIPGSTVEQPTTNVFLGNGSHAESNLTEKPVLELNRKSPDGALTSSNENDKVQNQSLNPSRAGLTNLQVLDYAMPEIISKSSKTSVNGDEVDEKVKNPVVQQKGRFKVTSENVETEKVAPSPILQKSHSVQVIPQLSGVSSPLPSPLPSALPSDVTTSNLFGQLLFPSLQSVLQTNILQRDTILRLMKQIVIGDFSEIGCTPINMPMTEKSLLEVAHDREKELLHEIADLQLRLVRAQEELQKYRTERMDGLH